jgi:hypothetical protein
MSYSEDKRYLTGKVLSMLILELGPPKIKGGEIVFKEEMGDDGVVETSYTEDDVKVPIHIRRLNVIFVPNGKHSYHAHNIIEGVIKVIQESCELMGIKFSRHEINNLYKLFISINGQIIRWNINNHQNCFFVPETLKKTIIDCIGQSHGTLTFATPRNNILRMKFDYSETELREMPNFYNASLYFNIGIKDITINNEDLTFREMNESGLIIAIKDEIKEDEHLQYDSENCAYGEISNDIEFTITDDDFFLNVYPYITSINGNSVNNFKDNSETPIWNIIDNIAKEKGW